ncbi:Demethylmenaquinone methyltransferase [Phycisphaerae bacterium RAS1]|nr:Demethylmenaquinone methyltransferase [Phycisphaerae bacterium RAS1]
MPVSEIAGTGETPVPPKRPTQASHPSVPPKRLPKTSPGFTISGMSDTHTPGGPTPAGAPADFELIPTRLGYDRWAAIYDDEDNPLVELEFGPFGELLGDVRGLQVLDVGCGTGRHALRAASLGACVTGVDFSSEMLRRAQAKPGGGDVRWVSHDLETPLPFDSHAFHRVTSALVIDHIGNLAAYMAEMRRVCRPDGFVLLSVLHPAMMLRGVRARFTDPATGRQVRPDSHPHQISDYIMGAVRGGLRVDWMSEHTIDRAMAARSERAARYEGWPVLLMLRLRP